MGPEARLIPRIRIADVDLYFFFSVGGPRRLIEISTSTDYRQLASRARESAPAVHHPTTSSSPPRPRCSRGILNPRSEDVDLYICEHFGQVLVSVGQNANRIAEYGLLKMLRSRCFATIVQRPISRSSPLLHEPRPDLEPPSLERVRAADSDFRS